MPNFHYKARNKDGADIEGDREVKDRYELARILRTEGITVLSVSSSKEGGSSKKSKDINEYLPKFFQRISLEEKLNFTRNTGVMVGAGISLANALEVMGKQSQNPRFKKTISAMAESIKKGQSFADSIGAHPDVFPKFYQEMVRAGEKSGNLEEALKLVSMQLKRDYTLHRKVRGAMIYPAIIVFAMVIIGALMLIYVVPTLIDTFKELDVELPASTRFIIFISETLVQSGVIVLVALAVLGYGAFRWLRRESGKRFVHMILFYLPVIKTINQKFNSARMCRTLSSLIASGVDVLEALDITKGVLQNHYYADVVSSARDRIQRGEKISVSFLGSSEASTSRQVFPSLVGEMIAVGEETGKLSEMLLRLATFYESEVTDATKDLSTIIEPVLMIIIGVVVGFFAISMISPMYNLVGAI